MLNVLEEYSNPSQYLPIYPTAMKSLSLPTRRSYCRTSRKFFLFRLGDHIAGRVKRSNIHTKAFRPLSWMYSRSTTSINVRNCAFFVREDTSPTGSLIPISFDPVKFSLHLDLYEDASAAVAHVMYIIMVQKMDRWPGFRA